MIKLILKIKLLIFNNILNKGEIYMLVRLYAAEIILGHITIEDVPNKLKDKVTEYLNTMLNA
jgi:hypothetical protein